MTSPQAAFARYQDLQIYVGWTRADEERVRSAGTIVSVHFHDLVEDFYEEIQRHPAASRVITGGQPQIDRLKQTLRGWLGELFSGPYDEAYVARRWRVGLRHVEIGLEQVYTAAALSRLRGGLIRWLRGHWQGDEAGLTLTLQSLNKVLDLDLAIISDAYETDYVRRQREAERQQLDDVLYREREISAGLFDHAQAAVVILDRRGRIVRSNPFLETLAARRDGDPADERDWFDLFLAADDQERLRRALLRLSPTDEPRPVSAFSTLSVDGRSRHLHWSGVPLKDATGQPFAVLAIGHDVTDLVAAQQRALQSERLAAIGQVATGLAHESRNALQRIAASAEMLELELEGNQAALLHVERIQQAQSHIHQLLDEVRNYAAPVVLDRSAIRITEAWREAWDLLHAQRRGRQVELREHLQTTDLVIEADRFRLVQVFRNLLDNALAAASDPVIIDVTCKSTSGSEPALSIHVRDNGPGLSAEQRERIFEAFYTTKPTGTGLGTAIAQRLVEAHGGTIHVGECQQPGTDIVVTLPVRGGVAN